LIEYEGYKWVKKQSFKDLAEWYADNFLTDKKSKEEFHSKKREERLEMAIQSIMTGVGIDYRGLKEIEKGRFFNSEEELKQHMIKELEFSVPEYKGDPANLLVEKLEETGIFEYPTKTYHYLKVNKKKFQEGLDYAK
jgi:hypothetical protein